MAMGMAVVDAVEKIVEVLPLGELPRRLHPQGNQRCLQTRLTLWVRGWGGGAIGETIW